MPQSRQSTSVEYRRVAGIGMIRAQGMSNAKKQMTQIGMMIATVPIADDDGPPLPEKYATPQP